MASLFIYKMTVFPLMGRVQIQRIESAVQSFLWGKGKSKIPINILKNSKQKGGLKLNDFELCQKSLHLQWAKAIEVTSGFKEYVYDLLCPVVRGDIWNCNFRAKEAKEIINNESFWGDVLREWQEFHFCDPQTELYGQRIWYNTWLRINGKMLQPNVDLISKGINTLGDIVDCTKENFDILNWEILCCQYNIGNKYWLWYIGLKRTIPARWFTFVNSSKVLEKANSNDIFNHDKICRAKKCSALIYNIVNVNFYNTSIANYQNNWEKYVEEQIEFEYFQRLFVDNLEIKKWVKLYDFQYRLLLGKIFTNYILKKWKVVNSAECEFCKDPKQDVVHLLVKCPNSVNIWIKLADTMEGSLTFDRKNIMENRITNTRRNPCNLVCLIVKHYIFQQKCLGHVPNFKGALEAIKYIYQIDKYNAAQEAKVKKCIDWWSPVEKLIKKKYILNVQLSVKYEESMYNIKL